MHSTPIFFATSETTEGHGIVRIAAQAGSTPTGGRAIAEAGRTKDNALAAERARHDQTRTELEHKERQRRAEKANATKLRKRIQAGTCPCCEKRFDDLQQHIAAEHPEFGNEPAEETTEVGQQSASV